jgi:hypothetical protein
METALAGAGACGRALVLDVDVAGAICAPAEAPKT